MIYVIQSGVKKDAPVKIGKTTAQRRNRRRKELQTGNPEKLYVIARLRGGIKREAELHDRFSKSRIHGEWFHRSAQIEAWLKEIDAALPDHALAIRDEDDIEAGWSWSKTLFYSAIVFIKTPSGDPALQGGEE